MTTDTLPLHPDLRPIIRRLLDEPMLDLSDDPAAMHLVKTHANDLRRWCTDETGWSLELDTREQVVRLYKRRQDPPSERGPWLVRRSGQGPQASAEVLSLLCVVLSQMWRTKRMRLTALERTVAQTCAAADGDLPQFVAVPDADEVTAERANRSRRALVDALRLGIQMHVLSSDVDLQSMIDDRDADGIITARTDRLRLLLASPSPTLLDLDSVPAGDHADVLATATTADVYDTEPVADRSRDSDLDARRIAAVRELLDDPAADPSDHGGYLSNPAARDRAVRAVQVAGLAPAARSDWWQVTDPNAPHNTFPTGRSWARQAALVVLPALAGAPGAWTRAQIEQLLADVAAAVPGWPGKAAISTVADDAISELVEHRLLARDDDGTLHTTPGVHLWDITIDLPAPETGSDDAATPALFDDETDTTGDRT